MLIAQVFIVVRWTEAAFFPIGKLCVKDNCFGKVFDTFFLSFKSIDESTY